MKNAFLLPQVEGGSSLTADKLTRVVGLRLSWNLEIMPLDNASNMLSRSGRRVCVCEWKKNGLEVQKSKK
jgi:hypothetical protein